MYNNHREYLKKKKKEKKRKKRGEKKHEGCDLGWQTGRVGSNLVGSTSGTDKVHPNPNLTRFRNGSGYVNPYPLWIGSGRPILTRIFPHLVSFCFCFFF